MRRRGTRFLPLGPLHFMFSREMRDVLIDWRMTEVGNRWRVQLSTKPIWTVMGYPKATRKGRTLGIHWAYWAKGNEG